MFAACIKVEGHLDKRGDSVSIVNAAAASPNTTKNLKPTRSFQHGPWSFQHQNNSYFSVAEMEKRCRKGRASCDGSEKVDGSGQLLNSIVPVTS